VDPHCWHIQTYPGMVLEVETVEATVSQRLRFALNRFFSILGPIAQYANQKPEIFHILQTKESAGLTLSPLCLICHQIFDGEEALTRHVSSHLRRGICIEDCQICHGTAYLGPSSSKAMPSSAWKAHGDWLLAAGMQRPSLAQCSPC
jgi:hypothetical protein